MRASATSCFDVSSRQTSGRAGLSPRVDLKHVLHRRNERGVGLGRDYPIFLQVRFENVFFSARPTVLKCALSTILRSMTCSASNRMVQCA